MAERVEHDYVLDDNLRPHEPRSPWLACIGHELRNRHPGVRHDYLLPGPHTPQEVREEVSCVSGVVLGKLAWLGVASWRGVATSTEKPLQHPEIVPTNLRHHCNG